jgi:hypothetical protein
MSIDDVMKVIDNATAPKVMSKESALAFLEEISSLLDFRMEALTDEIADEAQAITTGMSGNS